MSSILLRAFHIAPTRALSLRLMSTTKQYEFIIATRPDPAVGLITFNRPKALNALSSPLFAELNEALAELDADDDIGAIVLTGSDRAFAGASPLRSSHGRADGARM